jgi:hypothetical protein
VINRIVPNHNTLKESVLITPNKDDASWSVLFSLSIKNSLR